MPLGVIAIVFYRDLANAVGSAYRPVSQYFSRTLDWALEIVMVIGVPACCALVFLSEGLMATLFDYGEITDRDVIQAAASLRAMR